MATTTKTKTTNTQDESLQVKDNKPNHSELFTQKVLREFGSNVAGEIQITEYQRKLVQGYFIAIDRALKKAEETRLRKDKRDDPPVIWDNVNATDLALDVIHYARMGLDMRQDNHLFPIPYKNNKTKKYDITLMPGYNGIQYIAEKYAVERPLAVTIELVYSTDTFKPIKKSVDNKVEAYEFIINNAFDRGNVIGGFGYIEYEDPVKNKLIIMTLKDIEKRKPQYASAEFWGGMKKEWQKGKQVEVETDGWFEEMCLKTIKREVYSAKNMPRDPKKIDESYQHMKLQEARIAEMEATAEIEANANAIIIDTSEASTEPSTLEETEQPANVNPDTGEIIEQDEHPDTEAEEQTTLRPDF